MVESAGEAAGGDSHGEKVEVEVEVEKREGEGGEVEVKPKNCTGDKQAEGWTR